MSASNIVIIPILNNTQELIRISQMINTIKVVQTHINKNLSIKGILVHLIGKPLPENKENLLNLKNSFNGLIFDTIIFWDESHPMIESLQYIEATMDDKAYNSYMSFYKELVS